MPPGATSRPRVPGLPASARPGARCGTRGPDSPPPGGRGRRGAGWCRTPCRRWKPRWPSRRADPAPASDRPSAGTRVCDRTGVRQHRRPRSPRRPPWRSADSGVCDTATASRADPGPSSGLPCRSSGSAPDVADLPDVPDRGGAPGRPGRAGAACLATEGRLMSLTIGVDVGGTKVAAGVVDRARQHRREAEAVHARRCSPRADRAGHRRGRHRTAGQPPRGRRRSASARPGSSTRPGPACCSRPTWPGATSRCGTAGRGLRRAAGGGGERRERRGLGRDQVRRRARPRARHARSLSAPASAAGIVIDGRAVPRPVGDRRRARALPGRTRRAAVRLRQPRLLGAVRERQRPGGRGARVRQALAGRGGAAAAARRRNAGGDRRARRSPRPRRRETRRPCAASRSWELARPGPGRPGRDPRPGLLRHRRRSVRSWRPAARPGPGRVRRALTGGSYRPLAEIRLAQLGADAGVIGAADLARRSLTRSALGPAPAPGPRRPLPPRPLRSWRTG